MTKILRWFQQIVPTLSIVEFSVDPCDLFYGWYFYGYLDAKLGNLRLVYKQWKQLDLCQSRSQRPWSFWSSDGDRDFWPWPLARSNTGSPRFTDFPSLCACPASSLTNLFGSGLNLLCLQSHSKPECRWTWSEVPISSAWQKGPLGTRLGLCRKACTGQ